MEQHPWLFPWQALKVLCFRRLFSEFWEKDAFLISNAYIRDTYIYIHIMIIILHIEVGCWYCNAAQGPFGGLA